jgi:pyruvate/2-oxoglutarate/acetoin dehydrogenase E1 component
MRRDHVTAVATATRTPSTTVCSRVPILFLVTQIGAEIAATIMETSAFDYLDAPVERITGADVPMPYTQNLERAALPQIDDITRAVKRTLSNKGK